MFGQPYKSLRLPEYDYSSPGLYYVTICTQDRVEFFGAIKDGQMILNEWGKIALDYWLNIPRHFKQCELDDFIIMPNHVHGIIDILDVAPARAVSVGGADLRRLRIRECERGGNNDRSKMLLSKIIHGFKSSVTREFNRQNHSGFQWQRSFYEHIVRDEDDLSRIKRYICNNPANWHKDRNN